MSFWVLREKHVERAPSSALYWVFQARQCSSYRLCPHTGVGVGVGSGVWMVSHARGVLLQGATQNTESIYEQSTDEPFYVLVGMYA